MGDLPRLPAVAARLGAGIPVVYAQAPPQDIKVATRLLPSSSWMSLDLAAGQPPATDAGPAP